MINTTRRRPSCQQRLGLAVNSASWARGGELERMDGAVQRVEEASKRAVVFPYPWDMQAKWPPQQPRAIRLFDTAGAPLALTTSPVAGQPP